MEIYLSKTVNCFLLLGVLTISSLYLNCIKVQAQDSTGRDIGKSVKRIPPKPKTRSGNPQRASNENASIDINSPSTTTAPISNMGPVLTIIAPVGVLVELDGRARGFAGIDGKLILTGIAPGRHQIAVNSDNHEPWNGTFVMKTTDLILELPVKKIIVAGKLAITSNLTGILYFIDGKPMINSANEKSIVIDNIDSGLRQIKTFKEGYQELRQFVKVTPIETASVSIELVRFVEPEVIRVPEGTVFIGNEDGKANERPVHKVFLSEYEISASEITTAQYKLFIEATGNRPPQGDESIWINGEFPESFANKPVVKISWIDADAYCRWLSEQTGKRFRLPTEAEWERAAKLQGRQFKSIGKVWEWCADWYSADYYRGGDKADPKGPVRGDKVSVNGLPGEARVMRGGTFFGNIISNPSERNYFLPASSRSDIGFRIVRELSK